MGSTAAMRGCTASAEVWVFAERRTPGLSRGMTVDAAPGCGCRESNVTDKQEKKHPPDRRGGATTFGDAWSTRGGDAGNGCDQHTDHDTRQVKPHYLASAGEGHSSS